MNLTLGRVAVLLLITSCFYPASGDALAAGDEVEPPAESVAGLSGVVLDPAGQTVSGATVRVRWYAEKPERGTRSESELIDPLETGEDGRFVFVEPAAAALSLRVEAEGFAPWHEFTMDPGSQVEARLTPGHTVIGRALDPGSGKPLAGATVQLYDRGSGYFGKGTLAETATGEDGRFEFLHVSSSAHTVTIRMAARTNGSERIEFGEDRAADAGPIVVPDFFLGPGGRIAGVVVDAEGNPIGRARLQLSPVDRSRGVDVRKYLQSSATGPDGKFQITGVPAGVRYTLGIKSDEFASATEGPFPIDAGTDIGDLRIVLSEGASLSFRLEPPEGGSVGQVQVRATPAGEQGFGGAYGNLGDAFTLERSEDGSEDPFMAERLIPGIVDVEIVADGWKSVKLSEVRLREGETTDLGSFALERGRALSGTITDADGEPVEKAHVWASWRDEGGNHSRQAYSAEDGTYLLAGLWEGASGTITVRLRGFTEVTRAGVESGQEGYDFSLERPGRIRGTVVLADGGLPEKFTVKAIAEFGKGKSLAAFGLQQDGAKSRKVDAEKGTFLLEGLDAGSFTVEVRAPGRAPARKAQVAVQIDETADAGELVLEPGITIRGRVVDDESGAPLPGAAVSLLLPGPFAAMGASYADNPNTTTTDVEGRFTLDSLEPGSFNLKAEHEGLSAPLQTLRLSREEPSGEIVVRIAKGGEVRGTVRDASGMPVLDADIMIMRGIAEEQRMARTGEDGSYRFEQLTPGSYFVIRHRGGPANPLDMETKSAMVKSAEVIVVDFDERPKISLQGRVLKGDAPVAGASLTLARVGSAGILPEMKTAQTGEDGSYRVGLDKPGTYEVALLGGGAGHETLVGGTSEIDVPDEPVVVRDIILGSSMISGAVVDEEGAPVPGATVNVAPEGGGAELPQQFGVSVTGTDGIYSIGGIESGSFSVVAVAEGYPPSSRSAVIVAEGAPTTGIDFVLKRGRGVRGRVVDPQGQPVPQAMVFTLPTGAGVQQVSDPALTDINGAFEVALASDGGTDIMVLAAGWASRRMSAGPAGGDGATELVVQLSAGGRLRISVIGTDGSPRADVMVTAVPTGAGFGDALGGGLALPPSSDAQGVALLENLSPGSYRVVCPLRDDLPGVPVEVREGEELAVKLVVPE